MGRKKSKSRLPAKKVIQVKQTLDLTGLNEKCLKKVCSYLQINDLPNLSAACKRFIPICGETFNEEYNKYDLPFRVCELYDGEKVEKYEKTFIFLGKFIRKLRIEYDSLDSDDNKYMHNLIFENCSNALTEVHFLGMDNCMLINRTFPNLIRVSFTQCHLGSAIVSFEKWCPNVRQLEFKMIQSVMNTACIERTFPKLEHFALINYIDYNFSNRNLRRFIKLNRQLKELRICRDVIGIALKVTTEFISFVDQMLPDLESLEMIYMHQSAPPKMGNEPGNFRKLKSLHLTCRTHETWPVLISPIETIEQLTLDIEYGASKQTLDYILKSEKLQSLTWYLNKIDDLELVHNLSKQPMANLTELNIYATYGLEENCYKRAQILINIMDFMVHHKQLTTISVSFQMTENGRNFFNERKMCCKSCSKEFFVDNRSSDETKNDTKSEDECEASTNTTTNTEDETKKRTLTEESMDLSNLMYSFGKIVIHKFTDTWSTTYSMKKKSDKLLPVIEDMFIGVIFKKKKH